MTYKALTIAVDGTCRVHELPNDRDGSSLEQLQSLVEGCIEVAYVLGSEWTWHGPSAPIGKDATMYLNEEGKYKWGSAGYNGLATDLVRVHLQQGDYICGPVVICGDNGYGDNADIPEWIVRTVRSFPDANFVEGGDTE